MREELVRGPEVGEEVVVEVGLREEDGALEGPDVC